MTKESPEISVLMPVFNGAGYLVEAVKSILSQTFTDFELLIINDGSTDATSGLLGAFSDPRIKVTEHKSNAGLTTRLNEGLLMARGKYIARMDADDIALPERFSRQISVFEKDSRIVACGSSYYSFSSRKKKLHKVQGGDAYLKSLLLFATCFNHPTVMFRNMPGLNFDHSKQHAEDYAFWTNLAEKGCFHMITEPLLLYRNHAAQISERYREKQKQVSAMIRQNYLDELGFTYSGNDLVFHNELGNNHRVTSAASLKGCEIWLQKLDRQNQAKKILEGSSFRKLLFKYWMETCGNSSLGIRAFKIALQSPLADFGHYSLFQKFRLLGKCLVRGLQRGS